MNTLSYTEFKFRYLTVVTFILSTFFLSCNTQKVNKMEHIWNEVKNTTWNESTDWTGILYTFYEDIDGNRKCLRQFQGSGFMTIGATLMETKFLEHYIIKNDTIFDKDGEIFLQKYADKPLIFNRTKQIDIEAFKKDNSILGDLLKTELNIDYLNRKNFDAVYERVLIRPSRTILNRENGQWQITVWGENLYIIAFKKNGETIGTINSNLLIISSNKNIDENAKEINEINSIFRELVAWANGDTTINIDF